MLRSCKVLDLGEIPRRKRSNQTIGDSRLHSWGRRLIMLIGLGVVSCVHYLNPPREGAADEEMSKTDRRYLQNPTFERKLHKGLCSSD